MEQSSCCDFGPSSGKSRRVEEVPESPGPELTILSASVLSPLMNSRIDKIPKITQKHVRFDIPEDSSSTKVKETERVTGKRFSLGELQAVAAGQLGPTHNEVVRKIHIDYICPIRAISRALPRGHRVPRNK